MSIKLFEHCIKTNRIALISNGVVFTVITAHTPISTLLVIGTIEHFNNKSNGVAKMLEKLCTSKGDYWTKQYVILFHCVPFQNGNFS